MVQPLSGINISNSVNAKTLLAMAQMRRDLGLEDKVRIEHHITEAYKSIVIQPYCRRGDLLVALEHGVPNISAKHEGGDPEDEVKLDHPSDILDYSGLKRSRRSRRLRKLEQNFIISTALNRWRKNSQRVSFIAATGLHSR